MNRRNVLKLGAVAAVCGMAETFLMGATNKPTIRLGVCSYGFRKFGAAQVIDFMHQLNCPYLNIKDVHLPMTPLADVPRLAKRYRDAGIQLTDAGTIYFKVDADEDVRPKFEYLKVAGLKSFVGAPTHEVLPRVERFVKEYDVRMGLHNHGPHDLEWASPYDVQKGIEHLDPRIGYCIDIGHTLRIGVDPVAAIRMAGKRLYDLHVRDLTAAGDKGDRVAVPMGDGVMPIRQILEALAEIEYPYYVDLELENHEDDPMPDTVKSFAYMRKLITELGYRVG